MTALVPIGEFSRLTHLSVKTLRYYHDIDLLSPATIDENSGYRRYSTTQVGSAQLIRRLRDLDMPLPEVRTVLAAADPETRNATMRAHLERMEAELKRTQQVVASLRSLLGPIDALAVEYRSVAALSTLAIRAVVARRDVGDWCGSAFPQLYITAEQHGIEITGPGGATYSSEFFEHDSGEVVAFVPVPAGSPVVEGLEALVLPPARLAVAVHAGPFEECDRTYGALGIHVAEHDVAIPDPIREIYLVGPNHTDDATTFRTEVCWPIQHAA